MELRPLSPALGLEIWGVPAAELLRDHAREDPREGPRTLRRVVVAPRSIEELVPGFRVPRF